MEGFQGMGNARDGPGYSAFEARRGLQRHTFTQTSDDHITEGERGRILVFCFTRMSSVKIAE